MIKLSIKVMGRLINIVGSANIQIELQSGSTVRILLDKIFEIYGEDLYKEIMNEKGDDLAPYYKILIEGRNSKLLQYLDTVLEDEQTIYIMPPIAGG